MKTKIIYLLLILNTFLLFSQINPKPLVLNFRKEPVTVNSSYNISQNKIDPEKFLNSNEKVIKIDFTIYDPLGIKTIELTNSNNGIKDIKDIFNDTPNIEKINPLNLEGTIIPLLNNKNNQMIVDINIGNPPQKFNVLVDSGSTVFWIATNSCFKCGGVTHKFDESASSSLQVFRDEKIKLSYGTGAANGYKSNDYVWFSDEDDEDKIKFDFVLASYIEYDGNDGILGLAFENTMYGTNFGFMKQLFDAGKLEKNIYSQRYLQQRVNGELIIGDYPEEVLEKIKKEGNKEFLGSCPLMELIPIMGRGRIKNPYWSCIMHGAFTGFNKSPELIKYNNPVIFDTGSNYIYVDTIFWDIFKSLFQDLIDEEICNPTKINYNTYTLLCLNNQKLHDKKALNFVFGNWSFYLNIKDLFMHEPSNDTFISNIFYGMSELFIIGEPFLQKFISIFNKQDKKFELYGEYMYRLDKDFRPEGEDWSDDSNNTILVILSIALGIVVLCVLIYLIAKLVEYVKKRNQTTQNYNDGYMRYNENHYNRKENNSNLNSDQGINNQRDF